MFRLQNSRGYQIGIWSALITGAVAFSASSASAACVNSATIYCDSTVVQAYNGNTPTNYGGPGFVPPGVGDVLQGSGHPFDTDRVKVSVTSAAGTKSLELKYYTTFNGNDLSARYADIFVGTNTGSPDSFQYGIALGNQLSNGGLATSGFYSLPSNSSFETSIQLWTSKTSFIYGGQFKGLDGLWHDSPTVITPQATLQNNWNVNVAEGASGDGQFPYLVDVTLMASVQDFDALFGSGLSIFWGTGDCSNDVIEAAIPMTVPEPVTLGLFSAGLAGIVAIRRRKKAQQA
jgi:PEP-CTERM motif